MFCSSSNTVRGIHICSRTFYSTLPWNVHLNSSPCDVFFRLDALAKALSVIATATWLGGWLGGWLSHSGIVSKPLNLSENFFDLLKAPSL